MTVNQDSPRAGSLGHKQSAANPAIYPASIGSSINITQPASGTINAAFSSQISNQNSNSSGLTNINLALDINSIPSFIQASTQAGSVTSDFSAAINPHSSSYSTAQASSILPTSSQVLSTQTLSSTLVQHCNQPYSLYSTAQTNLHYSIPTMPTAVSGEGQYTIHRDTFNSITNHHHHHHHNNGSSSGGSAISSNSFINNNVHSFNIINASMNPNSIIDNTSTMNNNSISSSRLPAFNEFVTYLRPSNPGLFLEDLPLQDGMIGRSGSSSSDSSMLSHGSQGSDSCFGDDDQSSHKDFTELSSFDFTEDSMDYESILQTDVPNIFQLLRSDQFLNQSSIDAVNIKPEILDIQEDLVLPTDVSSDTEEGYSSSYEQPGRSSAYPAPYYELSDNYRPNQSFHVPNTWHRQASPESDEGYEEGPTAAENLPDFEKIQYPSSEAEKSPQSRRSTSSPKEKRKSRDSPQIADKERRKPGRKPGQVSNVLHLWEFMRDLLHSPDHKGIIEWISKPEGVFRVVNSTEVARLWGKKKKNKKEMTYEKLSRSLRYSRLEGYFSNLPKDKNYPKKLCFKFGPKSKDWY